MMKILFAASEAVPFMKTGGLADVTGSLPGYFDKKHFDVRIIMPKYLCMDEKWKAQLRFVCHFYVNLSWRRQYVGIFETVQNGITYYFVDNEFYFAGDKPYHNIYEDVEKFAFFSKAVLEALPYLDFWPDPDDMHIEDLFHALRFAFLILAQQKELYVLHSASFLYRGRAFLVSGSSGTGKSTHSALWHDLYQTPLLNGDLNLLGIRDSIPYAYGLPWCGTSGICTPKDYPLGGIIFLKQAAIDQVQSLQPDEKVLHILQRMISPAWTKELLLRNLHFSEALAPLIFSCRLYCTKESSAARTLKAAIDAL
jgi:hypothetical protein